VQQHHEQHWQTPAPVQATRYENPYPAKPAGGAHASTGRWSAQLARTQDTATQTYYELAFGDGRLQVMLTEPPAASQEWATGMHARSVEVLPAAGNQAGAAVWEAVDLRNTDAVQVAERILSDADQQAAEMRRQASQQAVAIREAAEQEAAEIKQQASAQAVPVREAAEREAAEIRQQATAQATAIRAAAEHEAAAVRAAAQQEADALRSAVELMSADLDQVAAYLTEKVSGPIERITGGARPTEGYPELAGGSAGLAARPGTAGTGPRMLGTTPAPAVSPSADPATVPDELPSPQQETGPDEEAAPGARATSHAMPATAPREPQARRAGPATMPARRTDKQGPSRQARTMRVFAGSIAALVTVALGTSAYQLATNGYTFFVFRSAGTGATNGNAVFPGNTPAPKPSAAHHQPTTGRDQHGARGTHHHRHPGGTHRRVKSQ
jgi:chemotaxis protein histidine kinase CheA